MATLDTVQKIVDRARFFLQDETQPYRYSDDDFVEALNLGLLEAFRLRKDLFLTVETPTEYSSGSMADSITLGIEYRMALVYFTCGYVQMADEEDTQDARATVFLNKALSQLMTPVA
jgi:hypothetical protein